MRNHFVVPVHPRALQFVAGLVLGAMAALILVAQAQAIAVARGVSALLSLQAFCLGCAAPSALLVFALPRPARFPSLWLVVWPLLAGLAAWCQPALLDASRALPAVLLGLGLCWVPLHAAWQQALIERAPRGPATGAFLGAGAGLALVTVMTLAPWHLLPRDGFVGGVSGLGRLAGLLALLAAFVLMLRGPEAALVDSSDDSSRDGGGGGGGGASDVGVAARGAGVIALAGLLGVLAGFTDYTLAGAGGRLAPATSAFQAWRPAALVVAALLALVPRVDRGRRRAVVLVLGALALAATPWGLGRAVFGETGVLALRGARLAAVAPALVLAFAAGLALARPVRRRSLPWLAPGALAFALGVAAGASPVAVSVAQLAMSPLGFRTPRGTVTPYGWAETAILAREGDVAALDAIALAPELGADRRAALAHVLHGRAESILVVGALGNLAEATLRELGAGEKDGQPLTPQIVSVPLWAAEGSLAPLRETLAGFGPESFDLIVQEPLDPLRGEVAPALTVEHFALLKRLLKPRGAVMLWMGLNRLRWESLGELWRSFVQVFDNTTLWLENPYADVLNVGAFGRDLRLEANWPQLDRYFHQHPRAARLAELELRGPIDLCGLYLGDEWFVRQRFAGAALEDDAHPRLATGEFWRSETPTVLGLNNTPLLLKDKEDLIGRVLTPDMVREEVARTEQAVRRQSVLVRDTALSHHLLVRARVVAGLPEEWRPRSGDKAEDPGLLERKAARQLALLVQGFPDAEAPRRELAEFVFSLTAQGRGVEAEDVAKAATTLAPDDVRLRNAHGVALLAIGKTEEAVEEFKRALEKDAKLQDARINLGLAYAFGGKNAQALAELRAARTQRELSPLGEGVLAFLSGDRTEGARILQPFRARPPFGDMVDRLLREPSTP